MNCNWVKDNLCDILDGLLPPHTEEEWRAHRDTCADCRQLIAEITLDQRALVALPQVYPPAVLKHRILAAVRQVAPKNPWKFFVPRLVPVAAAIVVTVASINMWPGHFLGQKASPEDALMETQVAPRVFSSASAIEEDQTPPPLLVVSSSLGGTIFVAWGAVVLLWYRRQAH
ncbi:MAG: hypothetical protein KGZ50_00275 [Peptococcaceae bacterium]|nr:hypothetical protein [Peptococcaceae bacterium]